MKQHLINKNSDTLFIFFTGWGCDEFEFEHLEANTDVLLLYDYQDLSFDFDFSKYKNFNLISFSAGVFIASLFDFNLKFDKKVAISGNPYIFDEKLGLSKKIQDVLCNITIKNADDFAKNYLIKTEEEWKRFHHSKRPLTSCQREFKSLKEIYKTQKQNIKDTYDYALIGSCDPIFDIEAQKTFYGKRLHIVADARHSLFFRIKEYGDLFNFIN